MGNLTTRTSVKDAHCITVCELINSCSPDGDTVYVTTRVAIEAGNNFSQRQSESNLNNQPDL